MDLPNCDSYSSPVNSMHLMASRECLHAVGEIIITALVSAKLLLWNVVAVVVAVVVAAVVAVVVAVVAAVVSAVVVVVVAVVAVVAVRISQKPALGDQQEPLGLVDRVGS